MVFIVLDKVSKSLKAHTLCKKIVNKSMENPTNEKGKKEKKVSWTQLLFINIIYSSLLNYINYTKCKI